MVSVGRIADQEPKRAKTNRWKLASRTTSDWLRRKNGLDRRLRMHPTLPRASLQVDSHVLLNFYSPAKQLRTRLF